MVTTKVFNSVIYAIRYAELAIFFPRTVQAALVVFPLSETHVFASVANIWVDQYVFPAIPNADNVREWLHSVQIVIQPIWLLLQAMIVFVRVASIRMQLLWCVLHVILHVCSVADLFLQIALCAMETVPLTEY